jgi:membrane protease YdiL (CAAX protease family)
MSVRGERMPLWIAVAAVLLGFAAGFTVTILVQAAGSALGSPASSPTPAVNIVSNYLFDLCFVASALYFVYLGGGRERLEFGYRRISWRLGIGAAVAAMVLYYVVSAIYAQLVSIHGTDRLPTDLGVHTSTAAAIGTAAFVCVLAPICEEFFFRGFLFGILRQMRVRVGRVELGPWIAAVIVAILFGLAHTGSARSEYLIPLGFLGFVLCLLRWRTGSLYPGMAVHSLNNCLAFAVNEMAWGAGRSLLLSVGSLLALALITGPLSRSHILRRQLG